MFIKGTNFKSLMLIFKKALILVTTQAPQYGTGLFKPRTLEAAFRYIVIAVYLS